MICLVAHDASKAFAMSDNIPTPLQLLLAAIAIAAFVSTLAGGLLALGLRDKLHLILDSARAR